MPVPPSLGRAPRALAALTLAALVLASAGPARAKKLVIPILDTALEACPGDAIEPTRVIEGRFPASLMGSYVMVPFEVPAGTTSVRVKYCYEKDPDGETVDLGLWQSRDGKQPWGPEQFRGWGGSSHPDVTITPQGFSTEEEYLAAPKGHVPGRTTRGFLPGPIPAGTWAIELGVGGVVSQAEGDEDGMVDWRVEIELSSDPAFAAEPYEAAPYDTTPANPSPGWYTGDFHVHAEHSALGDSTIALTLDAAFDPFEEGGANLDFVTLSDYVTPSAWSEIGRYQALHPGKLVIRSSEVITYRGHTNNHASLRYVDHRTGPVYELMDGGVLKTLRKDRDPKQIFKEVHQAGGWTQINHVTTCPSDSAYCRLTCRGCPWDYTKKETKLSEVDAVEVSTGFANPFTRTAIAWWEDALDQGAHITAVGSSDAHHAGTDEGNAIGVASTVVYAQQLTEQGVGDAVRAGHAYVKVAGSSAPDLRLEGVPTGSSAAPAIMGDTLKAKSVDFTAQVLNVDDDDGAGLVLIVVKDGEPVESVPIEVPGGTHTFSSSGPGRYRLELRNSADDLLVLTNPITVQKKK